MVLLTLLAPPENVSLQKNGFPCANHLISEPLRCIQNIYKLCFCIEIAFIGVCAL